MHLTRRTNFYSLLPYCLAFILSLTLPIPFAVRLIAGDRPNTAVLDTSIVVVGVAFVVLTLLLMFVLLKEVAGFEIGEDQQLNLVRQWGCPLIAVKKIRRIYSTGYFVRFGAGTNNLMRYEILRTEFGIVAMPASLYEYFRNTLEPSLEKAR